MEKLAGFVFHKAKLIIVFVILVNIIVLLSFTRFSMDSDFLGFFSAGNIKAEQYSYLNEKYRVGDALTLFIEAEESLLEKDALLAVYRLQQEIAGIAGVSRVQGFIPPEVQVQGMAIEIDGSLIAAYHTQLAAFIRDSYFLTEQFLADDMKSGMITVQLSPDADSGQIINAVSQAGETAKGITVSPAGDRVIQNTIENYLFRVLTILPPFAVALVLLVFFVVIKNWRFTLLSIVPAGLAAFWTLGTVFWSGQQLNLVTVLCPIFIIVIGSAYGLHLVSHFQDSALYGGDRHDHLEDTFRRVGPPIILSTITTMAGFISLILADVLPMRQMGIFVTFGIAYAGFLTLFFLPALLAGIKLPGQAEKSAANRLVRMVTGASGHKTAVVTGFAVLLVISGLYITKLEVVSDPLMFFKRDSEIRQTFEQVEQSFGGALPLTAEIAVDGGMTALTDYDYAQRVLFQERELEGLAGIRSVFSGFDLVEGFSKMINEADGYPQDLATVEAILAQIGPDNLSAWVTGDGIRLMIRTEDFSTEAKNELEAYVEEQSDMIEFVTGMPILFDELNRMVVSSQIRSLGLALILVFMMLLIMLRKLRAALVGLVPIVITIAAIMGMLSLAGFHLNLMTASLSAIAVGVGVDYSVHIIAAIHFYQRRGENDREAVCSALASVTRPVSANAFGLATGMSVLFFSPLYLHLQAASVMWVAMVVSSLAALLLIPIIYAGSGGAPDRSAGSARVIIVIFVGVTLLAVVLTLIFWEPKFNRTGRQEESIPGPEVEPPFLEESLPDPGEAGLAGVETGDGSFEVVELLAEPESTHLRVRLEQVPAFRLFPGEVGDEDTRRLRSRLDDQLRQIYLVDEEGREYRYREGNYAIDHFYYSACAIGVSWSSNVYLELPPLDEKVRLVTLVVPLPDRTEIRVDIPLLSP